MYYAYILKSSKDGSYYYGSCNELYKKLAQHNAGKSRYTKGHRPYKIHFYEEFAAKTEAMKREKFYKSIDGYKWLRSNNII